MRNVRLDETQAGISITTRNINNPSYEVDTTLMRKHKGAFPLLFHQPPDESERGE